jgi:hypothetical protein
MKSILLAALLAFVGFTPKAQAFDDVRELKVVMEEMGNIFKALGKSVAQGKVGAAELSSARQLVKLVEESATILPDLSTFPNRDVAVARYLDLTAQLLVVMKDAEAAISRADAAAALSALEAAKELRKLGHDEFKL